MCARCGKLRTEFLKDIGYARALRVDPFTRDGFFVFLVWVFGGLEGVTKKSGGGEVIWYFSG